MKSKKHIIYAIPAMVTMVIIFCFSAQHANESNASSNYIVDQLVKIIHGFRESMGMEPGNIKTEFLTFVVRKLAHTLEYAVLGACLAFFMQSYDLRRWKQFVTALCIGFLYACSDEFHQTFVPGRSGEFRDVLIDTNGVFLGILGFMLGLKWIVSHKKRK